MVGMSVTGCLIIKNISNFDAKKEKIQNNQT